LIHSCNKKKGVFLNHDPIPIIFYREEGSQKEPVRQWLMELTKENRRIIGKDLRTVQIGWPLGMPLVKAMGQGLWELRSNLPDGTVRIFFITSNGEIVLLHAIIKKSQKTPEKELETAKKRAKNYEKQ
jgi:phage-related protein